MIILASQSKQRLKLMQTLGLEFKVVPAQIDEQAIQEPNRQLRAQKIAQAKAETVQRQHPQAIIIAADTYCLFKNQVLEKPQSRQEAKEMLCKLSGNQFQAITGFCYLDPSQDLNYVTYTTTQAWFRQLTFKEIEHYVRTQPVLTWSAGFSPAYDAGMALIAKVKGSFTAFTHGLPLEKVVRLLKKSQVN